ncbi:F-box domain-containing protein [Favolaschia claudopus]|uniref:F-box domain-containing protein n=1 Tax=Favolaschia claudopus TaxID=2862362 RepID=A0AAW0EFP5_9AGAR
MADVVGSMGLNQTQKQEIRQILRAHSSPPPSISSTISSLAADLARCDSLISHLQVERDEIQRQYTDCQSLSAPIRCLPSEILVEIFRICWDSFKSTDIESLSSEDEILRLARAPLLVLSRVCIRWHTIVLHTPVLWHDVLLDANLWTAQDLSYRTAMELLRATLERSGTHPISISMSMASTLDSWPYVPALALVAKHLHRCHLLDLQCPYSDLPHLPGLAVDLSRLQVLLLDCWGPVPDAESGLQLLQNCPQLRIVDVTAVGTGDDIAFYALLPWEQLSYVSVRLSMQQIGSNMLAVALPRVPADSTLRLYFYLSPELTDNPLRGLSFESQISKLIIQVSDMDSAAQSATALEYILPTFALPSLENLTILTSESEHSTELPLSWPCSQFLSLSERSSFHLHLTALHPFDVAISESDILKALAILPELETFTVCDHPPSSLTGVGEQIAVTDTLLTSLTHNEKSPYLVPKLNTFECESMLRFDDRVYLDFILSRIENLDESDTFECTLWWRPGYHRELDSVVSGRIRELCEAKDLTFWFMEAEKKCDIGLG